MKNYELLLQPLQRREALRSSSLEGTYTTAKQLLLFEIDPKQPTSAQDPLSASQEVANYNRALDLGFAAIEKGWPISRNLIRQMHQILLEGVRGSHKEPGRFRRIQVHIGSTKRYIPPPVYEVDPCLKVLETQIQISPKIQPLLFCFMVHYQFEAIHPFTDGHGRVGRLLLSLMIYQLCGLSKPWLYLSAFFDKYKDEYTSLLFQVSSQGNWLAWLDFCLRGTIEQAKDSVIRFEALLKLRDEYMALLDEQGVSIRLNKVIEHLFKAPVISVPYHANMCDVAYNTARQDIDRLVQVGILTESENNKRPKYFFALGVIDIIFD
ncbi:Fic family protein [Leptothoe sp. ISB3NOV94-8A]|uniref:Fic family protein n=1 Tax=Adonisia turfae TaxID=2950184 RepID=UPI002029964D|nr:Fic family protein [Adonisia turfae]